MSKAVDTVLEADMKHEDHILLMTEDLSMIDSFIPDGMFGAGVIDDENLNINDDEEEE